MQAQYRHLTLMFGTSCVFLVGLLAAWQVSSGEEKKESRTKAASTQQRDKPDAKAVSRRESMLRFDQTWRTTAKNASQEINKTIQVKEAQARMEATRNLKLSFDKFHAPAASVIAAKTVDSQPGALVTPTQKPSNVTWQAKINEVRVMDNQNQEGNPGVAKEDSFLKIKGIHFGKGSDKCRVLLEYQSAGKETFTPDAGVSHYEIDLIPLAGGWSQSWSDNAIFAKVPHFPVHDLSLKGTLVVWRQGDEPVKLRYPVQVKMSEFGVTYIEKVPKEDFVVNGGEILIHGAGFGKTKGSVYIELSEPIGQTRTIDLTSASQWSDQFIHAAIPKLPGKFGVQGASLFVVNSYKEKAMTTVCFGPTMVVKWISGISYFTFDQKDEKDTAEAEGAFLKVTHDPGCGITGNNGNDWFFKTKPISKDVKILSKILRRINPDDPTTSWGIGKLVDILVACTTSPADCAEEFLKLVPVWFDSQAGSYGIQFDDMSSAGNPLYRIEWHNACIGPYDGVPNAYVASFLIRGPDWAMP